MIASGAACSPSGIAISINSTTCCAGWKKSTERGESAIFSDQMDRRLVRLTIQTTKSRPSRPAFSLPRCARRLSLVMRRLRRTAVIQRVVREVLIDEPAANERHDTIRHAHIDLAIGEWAIEHNRPDKGIGNDAGAR